MLIGLVGKAGSGKDTVANYLVNNYRFNSIAYADPIKEKLCKMLHIPVWEYDNMKRSKWSSEKCQYLINGRDILVGVGMMMREHDEQQFVRYVDKLINEYIDTVVTDVRFDNEIEHINKRGGIVIKIVRDDLDKGSNSITEQLADRDFEYKINNNSSLEDLYDNIESLLLELEEKNILTRFKIRKIEDETRLKQ